MDDIYAPITDQLIKLRGQVKTTTEALNTAQDRELKEQLEREISAINKEILILEKAPGKFQEMVDKYLDLPQIKDASTPGNKRWELREALLTIRESLKDVNLTPKGFQEQIERFEGSFNKFIERVDQERENAEILKSTGQQRAIIKLNVKSSLGMDKAEQVKSIYKAEDKERVFSMLDQLKLVYAKNVDVDTIKKNAIKPSQLHDFKNIQQTKLEKMVNKYLELPELKSASNSGKSGTLRAALQEVRAALKYFDLDLKSLVVQVQKTIDAFEEFKKAVNKARESEKENLEQGKGKAVSQVKVLLGVSHKSDKVIELYAQGDIKNPSDGAQLFQWVGKMRAMTTSDKKSDAKKNVTPITEAAKTPAIEPSDAKTVNMSANEMDDKKKPTEAVQEENEPSEKSVPTSHPGESAASQTSVSKGGIDTTQKSSEASENSALSRRSSVNSSLLRRYSESFNQIHRNSESSNLQTSVNQGTDDHQGQDKSQKQSESSETEKEVSAPLFPADKSSEAAEHSENEVSADEEQNISRFHRP